jgi:hypothetical protein
MAGLGLGDAIGVSVTVGVAAATLGVGDDATTVGLVVGPAVVAEGEPPHAARTMVRTPDAISSAERMSWNSYESGACR